MTLRDAGRNWFAGCRSLWSYDNIPGYRRLSWPQRKRLDHLVALALLRTANFWRGAFAVAVAVVLAHVVAWRFDLDAAPRELLRACPILLSLPWLLAARRQKIREYLRIRELPHRHAGRNM